jgi:hypothetical protein
MFRQSTLIYDVALLDNEGVQIITIYDRQATTEEIFISKRSRILLTWS